LFNSVITTPVPPLYLKNILHVPQAIKNLISAHHLAIDNYVFLEIHPKYFLLRIGSPGKFFLRDGIAGVSILFLQNLINMLLVLLPPLQGGTVIWVIPLLRLLVE
jgi:hypothetical protein